MNEPVVGLSIQAPVRFNGVEVGYVDEINLNTTDLQQVKLLLKVEQDIPITTSTFATLNLQGITGSSYLGLRAKTPRAPNLTALPGQQYPVIPSEPSFLFSLEDGLRVLTSNVGDISRSLNMILDRENAELFKSTLTNLEQFSQMMNMKSDDIANLIDNLSTGSDQLPTLLAQTQQLIEELNSVAGQIKTASDSVVVTMNSGQDTFSGISQQALPALIEMLNRLNIIAANLEGISNEMRRDPSVIVHGQSPVLPGPGE